MRYLDARRRRLPPPLPPKEGAPTRPICLGAAHVEAVSASRGDETSQMSVKRMAKEDHFSMPDSQNIVVLGFNNRVAAQEALTAMTRLQTEGKLMVRDAVFVTKDEKGHAHVEETTDPTPGRAALGGGFWGLLFGAILAVPIAGLAIGAGAAALSAKLIDKGLSDKFVKQLRQSVKPGKTYLAVLVSHGNRQAVLAELKRFSGMAEFVDSSLPEEAVSEVKEALAASPSRH